MLEFNVAPNTQIGRIDISNKWVVKYKGNIYYVKDNGCAYEFPTTEIDNKKVPKKIKLYLDEALTEPGFINQDGSVADIDYVVEEFETIEYTRFYNNENVYHNPKYSRSGEFAENLVCDNIIEFCKRWLGLGGIKEILEDYAEYIMNCSKFYGTGDPYLGGFKYEANTGKLIECPIYDISNIGCESPFISIDIESKPLINFRNMERSGISYEDSRARVNRIYYKNN